MTDVSYAAVPDELRLSFGLVQAFVIFYLMSRIAGVHIPNHTLLALALIKCFLKDALLALFVFNIFVYYLLFTVINTLFVGLAARQNYYQIFVSAVIVDLISLLTKPTAALILSQNNFTAAHNLPAYWLLINLPQLAIYLLVIYAFGKKPCQTG
ncbi:hypothetical protein [Desulforamulus hydrothermalis]|uniref:Rod shape-determining protein MreD n=1 Tax=Desulforamulus hydrothermalis Lam5 = DSM 18033 TaxID=1121428 RepID=K8DY32_9FIRM|nr:hypothetical protein [Desulforamulus hydrothermalis]CCO07634.1 membrane hypothetical protein [Desulforamulus hydrothermalis Lam5 = DSM 18033]SHH19449.1 hypothetical protein SAMN02745177_01769 [Desulforamulus hydrothermalis Lam5 = DSM 18033]